jgi:hypothetical protein
MSDNKPRKPVFGSKGTLPGGAGRYSLSSRPPKPGERPDEAVDPPIPGPAKLPNLPEIQETTGTQEGTADAALTFEAPEAKLSNQAPTGGAAGKDAWKGSTLGGWGTEIPKGTSMAHLRSTLAFGSSNAVPKVLDEPSPGTIRGTPPPPAFGTALPGIGAGTSSLPPPEGKTVPPTGTGPIAGRRISLTDDGSKIYTPPPESPQTQRATVPPARDGERPRPVKTIEVEPVRINQSLNTTLPPALMPICEELGSGSAATVEVSLLTAPKGSRNNLYISAVAIARRMAQVLPGQVVLVETDFETPNLAATLGVTLPRGRGFSEQLHARAWGGENGRWHLVNPGLGFDALFESRIRTPGLLWSDEFANAIATLRANYAVILLIAPNRITAVDHRALGDVTTGVYVISKEDDREAKTYLSRGPLAQKTRQTVVLERDTPAVKRPA